MQDSSTSVKFAEEVQRSKDIQELNETFQKLISRDKKKPMSLKDDNALHNMNMLLDKDIVSTDYEFDLFQKLALNDTNNMAFAKEVGKRIDVDTSRFDIADMYARARRDTYIKNGIIDAASQPNDDQPEMKPGLAEVSPHKKVALHHVMDEVIKNTLKKGYYRQHTAGSFIGDIGALAMKYDVPLSSDKINEFETINNEAQYQRFPKIKNMFGENAIPIIAWWDKIRGARLTKTGKRASSLCNN